MDVVVLVVPKQSQQRADLATGTDELLSMTFSSDSLSDNLHAEFTAHARKV